jgi:hypothetical protein
MILCNFIRVTFGRKHEINTLNYPLTQQQNKNLQN